VDRLNLKNQDWIWIAKYDSPLVCAEHTYYYYTVCIIIIQYNTQYHAKA